MNGRRLSDVGVAAIIASAADSLTADASTTDDPIAQLSPAERRVAELVARWPHQSRDRRTTAHRPTNRRDPHRARLPKARRPEPHPTRPARRPLIRVALSADTHFPRCRTTAAMFMLNGMRFYTPTLATTSPPAAAPRSRQRPIALLALAAITSVAACGDSEPAADAGSTTAAPVTTLTSTTPPTTATTVPRPAPTSPPTAVVDDSWRDEAAAMCTAYGAEIGSEPGPAAGSAALVGFWRDLRDRLPWFDTLDLPDELRTSPTDVPAVMRQADEYLADAEAAVAAGDVAAIELAVQQYLSLLEHSVALVTVAGAECGDPTRAANASLNVPVPASSQIAAGLGSVWASQGPFFTNVTRVDPDSGKVLATIDLGVAPGKFQPADGRMIVRTADAYMAIDPTTNSVVGTLAKSDVGPAANRNWAIDGAMWICDGQRLHRYDPATFTSTGTVIELGIDCGQVYATGDLVVAWTYNEDEGESGTSAAVFVDPANNQRPRHHAPASRRQRADRPRRRRVLPGPKGNSTPSSTGRHGPSPPRPTTGDHRRQPDGLRRDSRSTSSPTTRDVLVVDAHNFEVTDTIEPLSIVGGANALATTSGALWVATATPGSSNASTSRRPGTRSAGSTRIRRRPTRLHSYARH